MNRREFLATATLGASLTPARAAERTNVLFIAIDDLNDWIGCLGGNPDVKTPNLDRLASRGMLFTNAHCAAPLCNPSRAALMFGVRPSTSGIYTNSQPPRKSPALSNAVSLAQHFMANGYRVAGAGKIFHGGYPDPQSWHEYFPSQKQTKPSDPVPPKTPANGIEGTAHFDWGPLAVSDKEMGDFKVVDWVSRELHRKHDRPFFLACGLFRPHLPWYVPHKYFDMYPLGRLTLPKVNNDDLDDVPPLGRKMARPNGDHKSVIDHDQWRQAVQGYLASISFADAQVGRLMEAFDNSPYAKNTTIVLWSDHGWHLGEKLHWRKFSLWEEATHNVLMVVSPGRTKAGGRCARTVSLMDIYPTLIETCGLPKREVDGNSLVPLLENPAAQWRNAALTTYGRNNHSIRTEEWRYIRYNDGSEELYDRRKDPLEWDNLAAKPDFKDAKAQLARWLPNVNAPDSVQERGLPDIN
jgi:arylsulfatase A-like enzyme